VVQRWPLNLILSLGCAVASFYLVEKPLIQIGHRVAKGLPVRMRPVERSA
jgi:peptidoglycan/LPS O-acetylase OafA/YrhL